MTNNPKHHVTIYSDGMFGVTRTEAWLIEHGTKQYAQYDNAPYVMFIPKGKRKITGFVKADHKPWLVIVEGSGPATPDQFITETMGDMVIKKSKYSACDTRYKSEMDEVLAKSGAKIVADYRAKPEVPKAVVECRVYQHTVEGVTCRKFFAPAFETEMAELGFTKIGENRNHVNRAELQGQPIFKELCGPMWDGDAVRYEDAKTNELLST